MIPGLLLILLSFFYAALILSFKNGWKNLPDADRENSEASTSFSILIPFRNEEGVLQDCLKSIASQDYPSSLYEIVLINDHSDDRSIEKIGEFINENPNVRINVFSLPEGQYGKKSAIEFGVQRASNSYLIFTDADTIRGWSWLKSFDAMVLKKNPCFISGPVSYTGEESFFSKIQTMEFVSLVAIGGSSIQRGNPNLCNGANLLVKKEAFLAVGGYEDTKEIHSGDDEFLLHKVFDRYPDRVFFLKSRDALVLSYPEKDIKAFIQQRKRWVSKSRKYRRKIITLTLMGAWLFHFLLFMMLMAGIFKPYYLLYFIWGFAIKALAEFTFVRSFVGFFGKRSLLRLYLPAAMIYIFYVIFIGIYGNLGTYKWKRRILR